MDEKTSLLICLGAATAANCVPCFEHYQKKASAPASASEEILEAVELATKVKNGAHLVIRNCIRTFMGGEQAFESLWLGPNKGPCCG